MAAQFEQAIDAQEQMQQETAKQLAGRMKKKVLEVANATWCKSGGANESRSNK